MKMVTIGLIICIAGGIIMIVGAIIHQERNNYLIAASSNDTLIDETRVHEGGQMVHVRLERQTSALFFDKEYWRWLCHLNQHLVHALEIELIKCKNPDRKWDGQQFSEQDIQDIRDSIKAEEKRLDESFKK